LFAQMDPRAKTAQERMGAALGLGTHRRGARGWPVLALCAAALIAVLAPRLNLHPGGEFVARGTKEATMPGLRLFRVDPIEPLARQGANIERGDDLAFAYSNPNGFHHLLVFGVDEHKHVYWYYPAWTDPADDPHGIDIFRTDEAMELPEAIRHPLDGRELVVHAVFLDEDLSVRSVEDRVAQFESPEDPLSLPNAHEERIRLNVEP